MSVVIDGKPVSMWSNQELREALDRYVQWVQADKTSAILAEAVSRLLTGGEALTYSSTQHTKCAGCGKDKHTPLRRDEMGGYVCLSCIDKRLDETS